MGHLDTIHTLQRTLELISDIASQTAALSSFIEQHNIKEIMPILGERDKLITELAVVHQELLADDSWRSQTDLVKMFYEIDGLKKCVLSHGHQVLASDMCIYSFLNLRKNIRERQVKIEFIHPYTAIAKKRHFVKGERNH